MQSLRTITSRVGGQRNRTVFILAMALALFAAFFLSVQPSNAGECFYFSEDVGFVCDGRLDPAPAQFSQPDLPAYSFLDKVTYA